MSSKITPTFKDETQESTEKVVGKIRKKANLENLKIGKPEKLILKRASCGTGVGGGGFFGSGGGYGIGAGTVMGGATNIYSPEISTDFLELPQSSEEKRSYFQFFYDNDPFVGQAIDIHTEIPLSKVRIGIPKAKNMDLAKKARLFCEKWARRVNLLQFLSYLVHEYYLMGEAFVWAEDTSPDMPENIAYKEIKEIDEQNNVTITKKIENPDKKSQIDWLKKNYKGWTKLMILPPHQVRMKTYSFTDEKIFEIIPDSRTRSIISEADSGDKESKRIVESMSKDVVESIRKNERMTLNTDPDAGSFIHYFARKKSGYADRGKSILQRCIRTLVHKDKLRQAQASIASRHMTPMRIVSLEDADGPDIEMLREQIDMALLDPDFTIISNKKIEWEEMNNQGRLLDLNIEYEYADRQLYAGLGVTEGLLTGESSYSGEKINLEVINTRYMLLRDNLQYFVEESLFKPMCKRMGFIEEDEDGEENIIYPTLSFSRLGLRDNADTFEHLFNLYQKGSLDTDTIYELLNLDPESVRERLKADTFTLNDANFNEFLRSLYSTMAERFADNSNVADLIANRLGLGITYSKPSEGGDRF